MFHADRQHLHHLLAHFGAAPVPDRGRDLRASSSPSAPWPCWSRVTGEPRPWARPASPMEFAVVLGMRQMGLAMAARRLARHQREEIKTEVMGIPAESLATPRVRRFAQR